MPLVVNDGCNVSTPDFLSVMVRFLFPQTNDKGETGWGIVVETVYDARRIFGQVAHLLRKADKVSRLCNIQF